MPRTDEVAAGLPEATRGLVAAVRELMAVAATTEADVEAVEVARKAVRQVSQDLAGRTRPRALRTPFESFATTMAAGMPWKLGDYNPWAVPMEISTDGEHASARIVAGALHEGPPESVHGGVSAHLIDCLLGSMLMARGTRAVTASLELRYRSRTPLDAPLDLSAEVVRASGRKIVCEGRISHEGTICVEATGLFVSLPGDT